MDWSATLSALFGAVVGGGITVGGAYLSDRRRESALEKVEERADARSLAEKKRQRVRELHDRVSEDLSYMRSSTQAALDITYKGDVAEALDVVVREITVRHDRAASAIAFVTDASVRDAADAVYDKWAKWCVAESERMVNDAPNSIDHELVLAAGTNLATAIRNHLESLDPTAAVEEDRRR